METIAADLRRGLPWVILPLLAASALRLGLEPAYWGAPFLVWLALPLLYLAVQRLLLRRPAPWRLRLALLVNFLGINAGYLTIGYALHSPSGWRADALIHAIDRGLFRGEPQRLLVPLQTPWLTDVTILCYVVVFSGFLLYLFLAHAFTLSPATGRCQLGLMRLYGLGFSGYLLFPAAGPAFHHPALLPPIAHSALSAKLQPWVLGNCSGVDVCPSIHAAVCAFTLLWLWRTRRRLFPFVLGPALGLLLGTVYLQYHYFLDLPAGLLLGTAAALSVTHDLPAALRPPPSRPR